MEMQPNLGDFFNLPNPGLRAFFNHVKVGNSEDYRTPFWQGESRETVLSRWHEIFASLKVDMRMKGLESFELEQSLKVGPLSIMKPLAERLESIRSYFTDVNLKSVPIMPEAVAKLKEVLSPTRGLRPRTRENTISSMRLNTNSGTPYFTKRRLVVEKSATNYSEAAVLGWRGQEGGPNKDDVKQRVVWMYPFELNVRELQVYQPAIVSWQKNDINSAYKSMRSVEEKITKCFDTKGDNYVVGTDFTKFDQHFNRDLQNVSHELMQFMGAPQEWLDGTFWKKYQIPLICSESLMFVGSHGMGSGSGGTNFDESLAHQAMQIESAIKVGSTLNPYSNAYGDDGYLSFEGIDVDKVIEAYSSHGQVMNAEKQSADKHSVVYLRRYFHDSYRDKVGCMLGVYSTFRALGRLLGQERYYDPEIWGPEMVTLRALSILENCSNSPIFHQFIEFVLTGDKFKLGLKLSGFYERLASTTRRAMDLLPDFLGYTKMLQGGVTHGGINDWKVVQYLRAKL